MLERAVVSHPPAVLKAVSYMFCDGSNPPHADDSFVRRERHGDVAPYTAVSHGPHITTAELLRYRCHPVPGLPWFGQTSSRRNLRKRTTCMSHYSKIIKSLFWLFVRSRNENPKPNFRQPVLPHIELVNMSFIGRFPDNAQNAGLQDPRNMSCFVVSWIL